MGETLLAGLLIYAIIFGLIFIVEIFGPDIKRWFERNP